MSIANIINKVLPLLGHEMDVLLCMDFSRHDVLRSEVSGEQELTVVMRSSELSRMR